MTQDIKIRLATNDEGPIIKSFVAAHGFEEDYLDWNHIYPFWLVAVIQNVIVGCIQLCPSRPVARIEFLHTIPELSHRERSLVVWQLILTGKETLKIEGAQMISAVIPFELKSYKRILKRRGAVTALSGNLMVWRV